MTAPRFRRRATLLVATGCVALMVVAGGVRVAAAAPCGRPDVLDTVPPDGSVDVPPNAALSAHYQRSADYLGEDVVLITAAGDEKIVPATFDPTEGRLTILPGDLLVPGEMVTVRWPALRGLNAAAPGQGAQVKLTIGSDPDLESPTFDGLVAVRWDLEREESDCTDGLEERFIWDFDLTPASDDGGRAGLTLVIFQTAGPTVGDRSIPVLTQAIPAADKSARLLLPTGDSVGHICFAALVRDLLNRVSNSGSQEVCVDTTAPPFFRGCVVASSGGGGGAAGIGLVLAALMFARARARGSSSTGPRGSRAPRVGPRRAKLAGSHAIREK